MIKFINNRIYYFGIHGNSFKDITDEYLKWQFKTKQL